jgi:hypothetical protein
MKIELSIASAAKLMIMATLMSPIAATQAIYAIQRQLQSPPLFSSPLSHCLYLFSDVFA